MVTCFVDPSEPTRVLCAVNGRDALTIDCGWTAPVVVQELSRIYCRDGAPVRTPTHIADVCAALLVGAIVTAILMRRR